MSARLKSLAYRLLGSHADAEDVVAEAQLKLLQLDEKPEVEEAFLYRVVSNLCVDRLRAEKTRRKYYSGPWLPDPWIEQHGDDEEMAEFAEQLSIGFMLLLEHLSPAQRIAFVLREGFDFSFAEIAQMMSVSTEAARQHASRARSRLSGRPDVQVAPAVEQRAMLEQMMLAITNGDAQGMIRLLADDVVAITDGGGVVSAAIRPVLGRERITQVTMFLARRAQEEGELTFSYEAMNGSVGLVVRQNGEVHSTFQLELADGLIRRMYIMRNPHKLAHLNT